MLLGPFARVRTMSVSPHPFPAGVAAGTAIAQDRTERNGDQAAKRSDAIRPEEKPFTSRSAAATINQARALQAASNEGNEKQSELVRPRKRSCTPTANTQQNKKKTAEGMAGNIVEGLIGAPPECVRPLEPRQAFLLPSVSVCVFSGPQLSGIESERANSRLEVSHLRNMASV